MKRIFSDSKEKELGESVYLEICDDRIVLTKREQRDNRRGYAITNRIYFEAKTALILIDKLREKAKSEKD
jgi:hypothetical protein